MPRVDSFARKTVVEADSSKRSMSEIQKRNRKRNHNGSCVVKKGDKNATVYNSMYSPSTLAIRCHSRVSIFSLRVVAYWI